MKEAAWGRDAGREKAAACKEAPAWGKEAERGQEAVSVKEAG